MVKISREKFLEHFQRSGLTVWGFCEKFHFSFRTWTKILTEQKIHPTTARDISKALKVPREKLLEEKIMIEQSIGEKSYALRQKCGMSRRCLSYFSGVPEPTIYNHEEYAPRRNTETRRRLELAIELLSQIRSQVDERISHEKLS